MTQQLVADQLIEEARKQTGLERFDSESYREGLEVLIADMNKAGYPEPGWTRNKDSLVTLLANRLKVTNYLENRPELLTRPVTKPVFVFGIPRTGTTLLTNLFACDPTRRSPLFWEIDDPVPPAASREALFNDPRVVARLAQEEAMKKANPAMFKIYRMSAIYPNECIFFMAHDFKALMLESRGKLPNYRDWLFSTDMTSAYEYHKKFLQLLQADAPGVWNLKMPSHSLWLDTIKKIYPDARFIWTHRDPYTAMGSFCSIITMGHRQFSVDGQVDYGFIGENCTYQAKLHVDRIMDFRARHGEDSIIDSHYADLMANPIENMRSIYKALGDEFTPEAEAAMQAWLDDNPQGKFGKHEYKLDQYGLSLEKLQPVFERYLSQYDVASEGA
jgi:hypothetical protein